jgi:hypothetical protein
LNEVHPHNEPRSDAYDEAISENICNLTSESASNDEDKSENEKNVSGEKK